MEFTIMFSVTIICITVLIGMGMLIAFSIHENRESRKMIITGLEKIESMLKELMKESML